MKIPQHIFCQCMKPWKICVNKKNSYKIDVQNLIDLYSLKPKQLPSYNFLFKKLKAEKSNCDSINKFIISKK